MKKIVSLLLVMAMLCGMAMVTPVAAESEMVFDTEIMTSASEAGDSLAFLLTMYADGVEVKNGYFFDPTNATVQHNGETVKLERVGVLLTLNADIGANIESLVAGAADVQDVNIEKLFHLERENDLCRFAVRVVNISTDHRGTDIYMRPYYVINGNEYVYADLTKCSSVYKALYPVEMPAVGTDVDVVNENHLVLSQSYVTYTVDEAGKVVKTANLSIKNITTRDKTRGDSWVEYTCYDESGKVIDTPDTLTIGSIAAGAEQSYAVTLPEDTTTVALTGSSITYSPVLPAIGSDIDVTKKKNRIRVSAADATWNADGSIHVSLTFTNYTSNWITEETDYIKYSYYKDGIRKGTQTLYIGVIDTKKNPVKTFEFDVPYYTTEVRITSSKIVYWTEWS